VFEKEEKSSSINITPQNLKSLISKTAFAMGNQDWRHYLNGLYLSIEDTQITSVATDAHRLALASLGLNEGVSDQITGIVPRKSINEIGKLVGDEKENILLQLGANSITVDVSGTTFSSKLIEGKFPDYEQVIPSGDSSTLTINKKSLSESLSRVSVLSSEKYRGIRIITSDNKINISANNPEQEQAEESIDCVYSGEAMDIAFNVNYLQEIISSIENDNVEIHFFGSDKSCLITNPGSESFKYVVMPLLI
jgi:DNA polymerase-3 subunit beta